MTDKRKPWTVRMPEDLLNWLRIQAAKQTIKEGRNVSLNEFIVGVLEKFYLDKRGGK